MDPKSFMSDSLSWAPYNFFEKRKKRLNLAARIPFPQFRSSCYFPPRFSNPEWYHFPWISRPIIQHRHCAYPHVLTLHSRNALSHAICSPRWSLRRDFESALGRYVAWFCCKSSWQVGKDTIVMCALQGLKLGEKGNPSMAFTLLPPPYSLP